MYFNGKMSSNPVSGITMKKDMERPLTVLKLFACGASTSPRMFLRIVYRVYTIGMLLILSYHTFRSLSLVRLNWAGTPKSQDIFPIGFAVWYFGALFQAIHSIRVLFTCPKVSLESPVTWLLKFVEEEEPNISCEVGWKFSVVSRITFVFVFVYGIVTTITIALQSAGIVPGSMPMNGSFYFMDTWWIVSVMFSLSTGVAAIIWSCSLCVFSTICLFLVASYESLVLRLRRKGSFRSFLCATFCEYERLGKVVSNVNALYCGYTLVLLTINLPVSLSLLYVITTDRQVGTFVRIQQTFWFIGSVIQLMLLCSAALLHATASPRLWQLLRERYIKYLISTVNNPENREIEIMLETGNLMQVLKGDAVGIHVWKLWPIEPKMIVGALSLMLTYFIILVQFASSPQAVNESIFANCTSGTAVG